MARKARQRISYVLPLANSAGGHRLGVNGLAVDSDDSILYSGGRDGVICAWDLNLPLTNSTVLDYDAKHPTSRPTTLRQQVQAHTNWINDIALAHSNQALISASSDITVKLWRPGSTDGMPPQSIGLHKDYVKRLAVPSPTSDWVASGGLDRRINVWDLNGAGQKLGIAIAEDEVGSVLSMEKGSVYALAATDSIIASGGPEGTVKVWDAKTGKRVTKLVGHSDIVRDILISQDGSTIWTASGDRTVKVWSTVGARCMYTLTMHDASVWSLFSADPDLAVVYSSDKNGLVAKTDTRNGAELDEGLSVAVCQEHEGVHRMVVAGDCLWTATGRPSINRWRDVNIENAEADLPENFSPHRSSIATVRTRYPSPPNQLEHSHSPPAYASPGTKRKIPLKHVLRLSNTAYFPVPTIEQEMTVGGARGEETADVAGMQPVRSQPDFSIEGQIGLIKHVMLNDRKRVLTLDTAGEVVMWDLLKCVPIRSFGKKDLDDVKDEVMTTATVANWCSVNTRTGTLMVVLEEQTCFDAEVYADELDLDESVEYKEDQRINLGKWVLRYLFAKFIDEEIKRDKAFREQLLRAQDTRKRLQRENAPGSIQLPQSQVNGWHPGLNDSSTASTVRPVTNGHAPNHSVTPGLNIGLATPFSTVPPTSQIPPLPTITTSSIAGGHPLSPKPDDGAPLEKTISQQSQRNSDYFSSIRLPSMERASPAGSSQPGFTPGEPATPSTENAGSNVLTTPGKEGSWGKKKFRMNMNMSFSNMKGKLNNIRNDKISSSIVPPLEEKAGLSSSTNPHNLNPREALLSQIEENPTLHSTLLLLRLGYEDFLSKQLQTQLAHSNGLPVPLSPLTLPSSLTPSSADETPPLNIPPNTIILIQEESPEAGGVADLFEGTVGSLGGAETCDLVEGNAPMWLGDVLLRNSMVQKEVVKVSFILEPWEGLLPGMGGMDDGTAGGGGAGNAGGTGGNGNGNGNANGNGDGNNGNGNGNNNSGNAAGHNRLNANRMLRAKKVLVFVAERIEPGGLVNGRKMDGDGEGLRPEEYLELYCQGQLVPINMTLASIRSHLWKVGGDVVLHYKANGRREILHAPRATSGYPPK